jgi:6,7-dimethyl-8-ribityllumazine synthase
VRRVSDFSLQIVAGKITAKTASVLDIRPYLGYFTSMEKNMKEFKGQLISRGFKYAIIVSRFNNFITEKLLDGAKDALLRSGAKEEEIDVVRVPGAFEIPLVAKRLLMKKKYQAIICLAAIVRGETPHFDFIASEVSKGIAQLNLEFVLPVTYGIITADNTDQAIERAGNKMGNKGFQAAQSAIELLNLFTDAKI